MNIKSHFTGIVSIEKKLKNEDLWVYYPKEVDQEGWGFPMFHSLPLCLYPFPSLSTLSFPWASSVWWVILPFPDTLRSVRLSALSPLPPDHTPTPCLVRLSPRSSRLLLRLLSARWLASCFLSRSYSDTIPLPPYLLPALRQNIPGLFILFPSCVGLFPTCLIHSFPSVSIPSGLI